MEMLNFEGMSENTKKHRSHWARIEDVKKSILVQHLLNAPNEGILCMHSAHIYYLMLEFTSWERDNYSHILLEWLTLLAFAQSVSPHKLIGVFVKNQINTISAFHFQHHKYSMDHGALISEPSSPRTSSPHHLPTSPLIHIQNPAHGINREQNALILVQHE